MANIGDNERKTQSHVIRFFGGRLGYTYLGNLHDSENGSIMEEHLLAWLTGQGYARKLAVQAVDRFVRAAGNLQQGLYQTNKEVYSLLKYGAKVNDDAGRPVTVYFINFERPRNNDFGIAEEVTVAAANTKRPDLVVYVNGIALAIIELKRSSVSVSDGIRQNLTNQKEQFIQQFFTTIQFCMAGNFSQGLRYGTLRTGEKYYLEWKEDGFSQCPDERSPVDIQIEAACRDMEDKLDRQLFAMFYKERFLDLIHNFIVFDKGRKKVCRYNQYYAVKRAQRRLADKGQGGIIWHTQGSGKSLTMVWLSKWILANRPNARVLIVTDRDELDGQIEKTYRGVDETIVRTRSGGELIQRLNRFEDRLICSLIQKFKRSGEVTDEDYEKYVQELYASLPPDFSAKGDWVVFVDECHRTQSGKLHRAMKAILPQAVFIGFTGTPLLKKDKRNSLKTFGGYIHAYKFDEGVRDGVILDLRYEARDIPQDLNSQERVDAWFDAKTAQLTPRAKAKLKARWGTLQKVFSSRSRLEKIANDIIFDFATRPRLMDGSGNAILVADSIYSACRYYEIFQSKGFRKCAVISSYVPRAGDLRTDTVSGDEDTETFEKYCAYLRMIGVDPGEEQTQIAKKVADFEADAKRTFVEEPANMKVLIVVNKLLTGFDAPPCTYLYIDKTLHDHGLFQAVCRVNRLDGESKEFGYIVDYKQLFSDLEQAMNDYTSGAFADYDAGDVAGLLKNRTLEAEKHFDATLEALNGLCEGVDPPGTQADYIRFFCGQEGAGMAHARAREQLYRLASRLLRAYAELKPRMEELGYSAEERRRLDGRVYFYTALREEIGRASGDFLDLKAYEPEMRYLIDNYISAGEAVKLGAFDDFTLLDFILSQQNDLSENADPAVREGAAETIENNIRKKVVERQAVNPAYYARMSAVLEQIIAQRKRDVDAYRTLIQQYADLVRRIDAPEVTGRYPESIRPSAALRALYDNCGEDEKLAQRLHSAVLRSKMADFRAYPSRTRRVKQALYNILEDEAEVERVFNLIAVQEEY